MENLIENFLNGNIKDAKRTAKHFGYLAIREGFIRYAGFSFEKASRATDVLKYP